jgi:hypothetical protein
VQLRDALVDFVQNGNPCGYSAAVANAYRMNHPTDPQHGDDGLIECRTDAECGDPTVFRCACPERVQWNDQMQVCTGDAVAPDATVCPEGSETGRCVLRQCATDVAGLVAQHCPTVAPANDPGAIDRCRCAAAARAGNTCRILACFDESVGAIADGRLHMETYQ